MPAGTERLPSVSRLEKWVEQGLTHSQIVERIYEEDGWRPARVSVAVALSRAGLTQRTRYDDDIPWKVKKEHNAEYPLTMLRHAARKRRGLPLTEEQERRLAAFIKMLEEHNAVIAYDREVGFVGVPREARDGDGLVRKPE